MHRRRSFSIRGQLVLWYLGVLAVLMLALGIFQSLTLNSYLRSSAVDDLRHTTYKELAVLGPCYLQSGGDLRRNAQTLARLLGGRDTAVTIVTPALRTLASRGLGPPGTSQPLHLTTSTMRELIGRAGTNSVIPPLGIRATRCPIPLTRERVQQHRKNSALPEWARTLVSGGKLLLLAVPLGPPGQIVGYAILGRSLGPANATIARVLLIFALGAGAALLLAALIALPIINRALRPLRRVADAAQSIAEGDWEKRAHIAHSRDEIGRLGEAFDTMVDRLQAAMVAAAASEERMRGFLADASHELRTPATVLRGSSEVLLIREENGPPELVGALRDMHEEAVRLAKLIDDLLTLSRLDAGQPLAPRPVEVRPFLHEFVAQYASVWPQREIRLDTGGLDGATTQVDPEALRRVLTNLVDNSARYSSASGVITLTGEPGDQSVSITVRDEGPGLGPEEAERVFDRFFRADKGRSRSTGGTGLGLAIVYGLIQQSGGTIDFDTGPERGTTVSVTLPRVAAAFAYKALPPASARVGNR
jgi:signal transduction histidine kinase